MGKVTWRGLTGHPLQFILSLLAIAMGVASLVGLLGVRASLLTTYEGVLGSATAADVYVVPTLASTSDLFKPSVNQASIPASLVTSLIQPAAVRGILPLYTGPVMLLDRDQQPVKPPYAPSLTVAGTPILPAYPQSIGVNSDQMGVQQITVDSGGWPLQSTEIALEATTAAAAGYRVGDAAQIIVSGKTYPVTVVGIVSYPRPVDGRAIVILDPATAQNLLNPSGYVPMIDIMLAPGADVTETVSALQALIPEGVAAKVVAGSDYTADARQAASQALFWVNLGLLILAGLGLVVAGWFMANVFFTLDRRRAQEVANLRRLGSTKSDIVGSVVLQSLIVGAIGSVIGLGLGYPVLLGLRTGLTSAGWSVGAITGSGWPVLASLAVLAGLVTAILAGLAPAFRMAGRSALVTPAHTRERPGAARIVSGVLLVVAGLAGLAALLFGWTGTSLRGWIWLAAAIVLLVGLVLLNPALVSGLTRLLGWPGAHLAPASGRLARDAVSRRPRSGARTSAAIIVTTTVLAAGVVIFGSAEQSATGGLANQLSADYFVQPTSPRDQVAQSIISRIQSIPDTRQFVFSQVPITVETPGGVEIATTVETAPDTTFSDLVQAPILAGQPGDFPQGAAISRAAADQWGLSLGDELTLTLAPNTPATAEVTLPVALIVDSQLLGNVIVPTTWAQSEIPAQVRIQSTQAVLVMVQAMSPDGGPAVEAQLEEMMAPIPNLVVESRAQFIQSQADQAGQVWPLLVCWAGVTALIILASVAGGLGTVAGRRRGETGALRLIGLTKAQVSWSVLFEGGLFGLYAALIGAIAGLGIGLGAQRLLTVHGFSQTAIPVLWLIVIWLAGAVVGCLGAIIPARQAARQPAAGAVAV